jgi:hypothetical protein
MFNPIREIDIYGVFMPPLLLWAAASVLAVRVVHIALERRGFYRNEIEQKLVDAAMFVNFAGVLSFLIQ